MVHLAFFMTVSLAILIGQHQVHGEHYIPAGKHTFTIYKEHIGGNSEKCNYIYFRDEDKQNPRFVGNERCEEYRPEHTTDHSIYIHKANEKHQLPVTLDCTEGESYNLLPRIKLEGTESPATKYTEIFSGPVCV